MRNWLNEDTVPVPKFFIVQGIGLIDAIIGPEFDEKSTIEPEIFFKLLIEAIKPIILAQVVRPSAKLP